MTSTTVKRFGPHERVIWVRLFNGKGGNGPVGRVVEGKLSGKVVFIKEMEGLRISVGHFLKVEVTAEFDTAIHARPYHFYSAVPESTRTRVVIPRKIGDAHSFQASHLSQAEIQFNKKLAQLQTQHEESVVPVARPRERRIRAFTDASGKVHVTY